MEYRDNFWDRMTSLCADCSVFRLYSLVQSKKPIIYTTSPVVVTIICSYIQGGAFLIRPVSQIQQFDYSFAWYELPQPMLNVRIFFDYYLVGQKVLRHSHEQLGLCLYMVLSFIFLITFINYRVSSKDPGVGYSEKKKRKKCQK